MLLAIVAWRLIELRKKGESGLQGDEAGKSRIFANKLEQLRNKNTFRNRKDLEKDCRFF